jgi:hypothetical protein
MAGGIDSETPTHKRPRLMIDVLDRRSARVRFSFANNGEKRG